MTGPAPSTRSGAVDVPLAAELASAARRLADAGVASPRADAELLAAHVLGVARGRLPLVREIAPDTAERLRGLVTSRARRVPLQHLTGEAYFRHLALAVGPGVFVPRPETETVVGWVIDVLKGQRARENALSSRARRPMSQELKTGTRLEGTYMGAAIPHGSGHGASVGGETPSVCVDLCAGSGAIALALADEVPGTEVHAVEADPAALRWLRHNVAATGLPVEVHSADVTGAGTPAAAGVPAPEGWAGVPVLAALARLTGRVDVVVSNPPYLPDADRAVVTPEVGDHDPPWALWGGGDGLAGPRAVAVAAAGLLRPGGLFAMEHADGQGPVVRELLATAGGWNEIVTHRDLVGRDRFVTARLLGSPGHAEGAIWGKQ
ncbi:HemK/PrmC family methyltransferase [Pseudofrankia sp. BMG5.37]|uniref:N5-glutamine methyltransferase family protein n=1 Tax=Pseudofrankia sp. BMG5.37 TaxID=3050035 RepID=UPI0028959BBF|nr:HemK/PrmC family methyltransferase [Pseudofrankia sp. BMG5.37]MDT3445267.1 HemK/PrmC family methyltransferase [Pseudofrankia sp. BMG5.37]